MRKKRPVASQHVAVRMQRTRTCGIQTMECTAHKQRQSSPKQEQGGFTVRLPANTSSK